MIAEKYPKSSNSRSGVAAQVDGIRLRLWLAALLTLSGTQVRATTPAFLDSVKNHLAKTQVPLEQMNCLYTLSYEYGLIEPKTGILYARRCLDIARRHQNTSFQLNAYNGMANAYETMGKYDSALNYHQRSYEISLLLGDQGKTALTIHNIALCRKQLGQYREALADYLRAHRILDRLKAYNPRTHYHISEMYMKTGDWKLARYHAELGIVQSQRFNMGYISYSMQVNLARCMIHEGKYDSALQVLNAAVKGLRGHTDQKALADGLNALGELHLQRSNNRQAYAAFTEEERIHRTLKNVQGLYLACINRAMSMVTAPISDREGARMLLQESEVLKNRLNGNADMLAEGMLRSARVYQISGDWKKALLGYHAAYRLRDSLFTLEKYRQLGELQLQFETEKKQYAIDSLRQSNILKNAELISKNRELRQRNIILALGALLVILSGVLFYAHGQRRKWRTRLEKELAIRRAEENERMRLARDIHDDLGSGLSKISFLSDMLVRDQAASTAQTSHAKSISETAGELVVNMRDLIWALNPSNTSLSGLIARIREYTSDYLEDYHIEPILQLPEDADATPITKESHRHILMVLKECLNNAVKHSGASRIVVTVEILDDVFRMRIQDNGSGFEQNNSQGNGLFNMKSRMASLGGSLELISRKEDGTLVQAVLPLKSMLPAITTNVV